MSLKFRVFCKGINAHLQEFNDFYTDRSFKEGQESGVVDKAESLACKILALRNVYYADIEKFLKELSNE